MTAKLTRTYWSIKSNIIIYSVTLASFIWRRMDLVMKKALKQETGKRIFEEVV